MEIELLVLQCFRILTEIVNNYFLNFVFYQFFFTIEYILYLPYVSQEQHTGTVCT